LQLAERPTRLECLRHQSFQGEAGLSLLRVFGPRGPLEERLPTISISKASLLGRMTMAAMLSGLDPAPLAVIRKGRGQDAGHLLVDGGQGQMSMALEVLQDLAIHGPGPGLAWPKVSPARPALEL